METRVWTLLRHLALCRVRNGLPGSSAGKESACIVGDPSSSPGSGRSPGEGIGYPLQFSWASLVARMVKNMPAVWETWVWSLGWEDSLEEGMATHSSIVAWRIPMDRGAWWAAVHGVSKSQTQLNNQAQHSTEWDELGSFFWKVDSRIYNISISPSPY